MKWEPIAAMLALLALGLWVVWGPSVRHDIRPGAELVKFTFANTKGELEVVRDGAEDASFRLLYRDGRVSEVISAERFREFFGEDVYRTAVRDAGNPVFRALNVTSWGGLVWVGVGFAGQMAFFGRMLVQWIVSEKRRASVIPEVFWWLSLGGGVLLFAYFAWRQDAVALLGQTSGVVIYARNIRLIMKQRRRDARRARETELAQASGAPAGA